MRMRSRSEPPMDEGVVRKGSGDEGGESGQGSENATLMNVREKERERDGELLKKGIKFDV